MTKDKISERLIDAYLFVAYPCTFTCSDILAISTFSTSLNIYAGIQWEIYPSPTVVLFWCPGMSSWSWRLSARELIFISMWNDCLNLNLADPLTSSISHCFDWWLLCDLSSSFCLSDRKTQDTTRRSLSLDQSSSRSFWNKSISWWEKIKCMSSRGQTLLGKYPKPYLCYNLI